MLGDYLVLCLAAALGGGINAVAGGGTLLTFPALVAVFVSRGLSEDAAKVLANGTSTVALFPASLAAVWGYRREFAAARVWLKKLLPPSIAGGILGASLVTQLPERTFAALVPWLILIAAALFTLQPWIARRLGIGQSHKTPSTSTVWGVIGFQFLVGTYGGYFGAGIGILMLAALSLMGQSDIHVMNGLKSLLASGINGSAVVIFVLARNVDWPIALAMAIAGCMGAYAAARVARQLPRSLIRGAIIVIGFTLAVYYFSRN